jgi:TAK1-binding protein 1
MESEKWTDTLKLDTKYCGLGTAVNQLIHKGVKTEAHPNEDRSFRYVLKDNSIYAYGILDGFNGIYTVDIVNASILLNLYFDHLNTLVNKTDEDVYELISNEFKRTERLLLNYSRDKLDQRNMLTNSLDVRRNFEAVKTLDNDLSNGAFALITILIENRLFVVNLGTSSCFICFQNDDSIYFDICANEHLVSSQNEIDRLSNLHVDLSHLSYTRCLGDFKTKFYFRELDEFKNCPISPISNEPEYAKKSIDIDDNKLFIVMCSNEVLNILKKLNNRSEDAYHNLLELVINKIAQEKSLNCAVQAVIDEIRRQFDDKFVDSTELRDDMTLLVRIFDEFDNLQARLLNKQQTAEQSLFKSFANTHLDASSLNNSLDLAENRFKDDFDENGYAKAYVNFSECECIFEDNKDLLRKFEIELENCEDSEESGEDDEFVRL